MMHDHNSPRMSAPKQTPSQILDDKLNDVSLELVDALALGRAIGSLLASVQRVAADLSASLQVEHFIIPDLQSVERLHIMLTDRLIAAEKAVEGSIEAGAHIGT